MATHLPWNLAISLFIALLPMSVALAGGRAVGGGPPAGAVGGGPPAGLIGGGPAPTNTNPTSGSGAGALSPTVGGAPEAYPGGPPAADILPGGPPPAASTDDSSAPGQAKRIVAPRLVEGVAEEPPPTATGFAPTRLTGLAGPAAE